LKKIAKSSISIMLIFFLCVQSLVCYSQIHDTTNYSDISNHWAKEEILKLMDLGHIRGIPTSNGIMIQPDRNITRAEFVAVIVEILDLKEINGEVKVFSDVKRDNWYGKLIDIASSNDIINGYLDGTFRPDNYITRAEITQLIFKLCKFNTQYEIGESLFSDVKVDNWFYSQVMMCKKNNIIRGYPDNTFRPLSFATRAEAFCILENSLSFVKIVIDEEEIPGAGAAVSPTLTPVTTNTPTPHSKRKRKSVFRPTPTKVNDSTASNTATTTYKSGTLYFVKPESITVSDSVYIELKTVDVPSIKLIQCKIKYKDGDVYKSDTYNINDYETIDSEKGIYEFGLYLELPGYRNEIEVTITDLNDRLCSNKKIFTVNIDTDNDGLLDGDEILEGTSRLKSDTDGDGLSDYEELKKYDTNPLTDDTDEDGLSDWAEVCPWKVIKEDGIVKVDIVGKPGEEVEGAFFISPLNSDTDGDGLNDCYEVIELSTNPSSMFTLDNTFRDSDMDFDGDGLTNMEEVYAGTSPYLIDTDGDGLTDGAEIKIHSSNPLNQDTDADGHADGKEIKNGSSPLDIFSITPGILDSRVTVSKAVYRKVFEDKISAVSDTLKLIDIEGDIGAAENLSVQEVVYMNELSNIEGIIGTPLDISCNGDIISAKLTFEVSEDTLGLHEIQNLKVFTVNEGKLNILDTSYDEENGQISASTNHFSIYGIIDIFKLIESLMLDEDEKEGILDMGKADVVFVIDSTGSMGDEIKNVIKNVNSFAEELGKDIEVRFGLIDYKDITADGEKSTVNCGWYNDVDEFKKRVSKITVIGGGDAPESAVDALEEARRIGFRTNANKFIILLTDAGYKNGTRFEEVKSMEQEINLLKKGGIITSVVSENRHESVYNNLYKDTDGIFANIREDFAKVLKKLSSKIKKVTLDGSWIRLSDLSVVKLDKKPDEKNTLTDTDLDGIADSVELDCKKTVSIGGHEVSVWDYYTNPVIKDTEAKIRNVTVSTETVKTGERFKIYADMFSPIGCKDTSQVVVQLRLSNGKWISLGDILSNTSYRDKYLMSDRTEIFNKNSASVVRYEKFIEILEEGKHELKVSALLDDGTVIESVKRTILVNADKSLVWNGIDTSKTDEVGGVLDLNVSIKKKIDSIQHLQICAVEVSKKREIYFELVDVSSDNQEYTLKLDTTNLENNKNYDIIALGLNSQGEVELATSVYNVIVRNSLPKPQISPESGEFDRDVMVSMKMQVEGGVIRYTLDGSDPTILSPVYDEINKLLISASKYDSVVLKAAVFKEIYMSPVETAHYSFNKDNDSSEDSTEDDLLKLPYKQGDNGAAIKNLQKALDTKVDISASEVMIKNNTTGYTQEFTALTKALVTLYQQQLEYNKDEYSNYSSKIEEALSDGFGVVNQALIDLLNDFEFSFLISKPSDEPGKFKLNSSMLWEFVEDQITVDPISSPVESSGLIVYLSPSLQSNVGVGNFGYEYNRMRDIAYVVRDVLEDKGIKVYINKSSWRNMSEKKYIDKIITDCNSKRPNVFYSIRTDKSENEDERGMSVIWKCKDDTSKDLAVIVEKKVFSISPSKEQNYWRKGIVEGSDSDEISSIDAAANIIEIAYCTNKLDAKWVVDNTDEIGKKIAEGILEYFGL